MSSERVVVRSLLVPAAPFHGEFKMNVVDWMGLTPTSQGPVLLVTVIEPAEAKPTSALLNAQGQRLMPTAPEAPTWAVVCVQDGQEQPDYTWRWIGGIAANNPTGQLVGLFYYARLKP